MATFRLANEDITVRPITYEALCVFEQYGVSLLSGTIDDKNFSMLRAYVAYCANVPTRVASDMIERHVMGGGDIQELFKVLIDEVNGSSFFQALVQRTEATQTVDQEQQAPQLIETPLLLQTDSPEVLQG